MTQYLLPEFTSVDKYMAIKCIDKRMDTALANKVNQLIMLTKLPMCRSFASNPLVSWKFHTLLCQTWSKIWLLAGSQGSLESEDEKGDELATTRSAVDCVGGTKIYLIFASSCCWFLFCFRWNLACAYRPVCMCGDVVSGPVTLIDCLL